MNTRQLFIFKLTIILLGLAFYCYYGFYKMIFVHFELVGGDFIKGYYTAQNFMEGCAIYKMPKGINPYYYPPITLIIFLPFTYLSSYHAVICWYITNHLVIIFSAWMIYKFGSKINKMNSAIATVSALAFSMPLQIAILTGNVNLLIFVGFCLVYHLILSRKERFVSLILAGCIYLKIFPALLMISFIRNKNWTVLNYFVISMVVLGLISIGIFGLDEHCNLLKHLGTGSKYVGPIDSMSFFFIMKLFLSEHYEKTIIVCNVLFAIFILTLWWIRANRSFAQKNKEQTLIVDLFITTVIVILLFPLSWTHYHIFFIIPFYFILFGWLQNKSQFKYISVFIVLFCLINFWGIIYYQLPLSLNGLTICEIGECRHKFPVLYPLIYSLPFVLNMVFFSWLLINYNEIQQVIKSLKRSTCSNGKI